MALLRNITGTAVGRKPQLHGESVCLGVRTSAVKHMAARLNPTPAEEEGRSYK